MRVLATIDSSDSTVVVATSERIDGDLSISNVDPAVLRQRRQALVDRQWAVVRQIHSADVVHIAQTPPRGPVGSERALDDVVAGTGDALLATRTDFALAAHSADCPTVAFVGAAGVRAVAHAGWRGLQAGVLEATVRALRDVVETCEIVSAVVGPHICANCYAFSPQDLAPLTRQFGPHVESQSRDGHSALDLAALVATELDRLAVELVAVDGRCTSCDSASFWSHRARKETGRTALVVWHTS